MKITYERGPAGIITKVVQKVNGFSCVTTLKGELTQEQVIEAIAVNAPKEIGHVNG